MRDSEVASLQDFPFTDFVTHAYEIFFKTRFRPFCPAARQARFNIGPVVDEFRVFDATDVFNHHRFRVQLVNKFQHSGEKVPLVILPQLLSSMRKRRARHASRQKVEVATLKLPTEELNRLAQAGFGVLLRRNRAEIVDVIRNDITVLPFPAPVRQTLDVLLKSPHCELVDLYKREMLEACLMEADGLPAGPCADLDGGQQRTIIRGHGLLLV
ncbi:hypothetical protein ADK56_21060 [Streptomyces sp. MMG1522]|nr:hypothetical protein ADK56_21060 [Streptomyces sp. MMG1522]